MLTSKTEFTEQMMFHGILASLWIQEQKRFFRHRFPTSLFWFYAFIIPRISASDKKNRESRLLKLSLL